MLETIVRDQKFVFFTIIFVMFVAVIVLGGRGGGLKGISLAVVGFLFVILIAIYSK